MSNQKTFTECFREDRRLVLLRFLNEQPGKQSNSSILRAGLQFVHIVAEHHEVIADLQFLQLHQLIELEPPTKFAADVYGAKLRARGIDVVNGLVEVDGISSPRRP